MLGIVLIFAGLLIYELLWGKLFPYSPVAISFTKHELPHTIIYIQDGAKYKDLVRLDTLIPAVEHFHELKFKHKPDLFIFSDSISFIHRSLSDARFCVYYNSRLLISPWALREALEDKISLEIYLRHELSHSLIHQYSGIINAYKYPKWLMEGIAVYSSNQMGTSLYPGKDETYELIRGGNFMPPKYFRTSNEHKVKVALKNSVTFMYSEFACVVDFLIETYGKEKFLIFMQKLTLNPKNDAIFREIYGIDFSEFSLSFKRHVMANERLK